MDDEAVEETLNMLVDETTAVNKENNSSTPVNDNLADRIDFSKGLPVNLTDLGLAVDGRQRFDMPEDNEKPSTPDPIPLSDDTEPIPGTSNDNSILIDEEQPEHHTETPPILVPQNGALTEQLNAKRALADVERNDKADDSDTSSVCEILDDSDEEPPPPPKKAKSTFGTVADVLKAAQNNTLFQETPTVVAPPRPAPAPPTALTKDEFLQNFVDYVKSRIEPNPDQKIVDVMTNYVEEQSRSRPLGIRKLMESNNIVKPVSVSVPTSQVVEMLAEFEPDQALSSLTSSDNPVPLMSAEQAHRIQFAREPCPNFTRVLYDLGFSLTLESTYRSIITKRSRDDAASKKDGESSKASESSVAITRLKKTYDELKDRNSHFKVKQYRCKMTGCNFVTDTHISLDVHKQTPHRSGHRWTCAICDDFRSHDRTEVADHYSEDHGLPAMFDDLQLRAPCPVCDLDFHTKIELKIHLKECRIRNQGNRPMGATENDKDVLNKWLWPKLRTTSVLFESRRANAFQPRISQIMSSVQPKNVRKSVHDVVNSVVGGEGRLMPRLVAPNSRAPGIISTNGPAYLVRNGNSYSILNAGVNSQNPLLKQIQQRGASSSAGQQGPVLVNYVVCCEICDGFFESKILYIDHLRDHHKKLTDKPNSELFGPAPLACSRCKERFYTYEGLERHLLMKHSLVTSDLLQRAHRKQDNGKCKLCGKVYAFNLLHHLVQDHKQNLCSAEILYSCDLCPFQCKSYVLLENHLRGVHSNGVIAANNNSNKRPLFNFQPVSASTPKVAGPQNVAVRQYRPLVPTPVVPSSVKPTRLPHVNGVRYRSDAQVLQQARVQPNAATALAKQVQQRMASASTKNLSQPEPLTAKKTLRYCCTPCALKFATYDEVIKHWSEKHLSKVLVKLCRIDECDPCKTKIESQRLNLDFTEYEPSEDDDLQIIDEKSKNSKNESDDIITLD